MNSSPEPPVNIPVEIYCTTNLMCPDLPFAENRALKNRKLVKEIFYCIAKINKSFDRFFYRVLKKQETN